MKRAPAARRDPALRVTLLPKDTNRHGTIFGGVILQQLDLAGSVEAHRHRPHRYVTVCIREVVFVAPVYVGDVVSFYTRTKRLGRTSVTVEVDVEAERADGSRNRVTTAEIVYVSVDEAGRPTPIRSGVGRP